MVAMDSARSKGLLPSLILCGALVLAPLANVVSAKDPKEVVDKNLGEAIILTQNLMRSASEGCSGGSHGVPPYKWGDRQVSGVKAQNALNELRRVLAAGQTASALDLINTASSELQKFVSSLHESCIGGRNGVDPVNYGAYLVTLTTVKAKLEVLRELLE